MNPGRYDLALYHGDTYRRTFRLWHDAARTVPVDLAGVDVAAEIRDEPQGALAFSFLVTVELPNLATVLLTAEDWTSYAIPLTAWWDLELTFPSGDVETYLAGAVRVTKDVTHSVAVATP